MSEAWPVLELFSPILIGNYIRFETAAKYMAQQETGNGETVVKAKFKLKKECYEKLCNSEYQAPLLGLKLSFDETTEVLTVEADEYFKSIYENKIMRDVAQKQCEDCKIRYTKFIEFIE